MIDKKIKKKDILTKVKKPIKEKDLISKVEIVQNINDDLERYVCSYCKSVISVQDNFCKLCGTKVNIEKKLEKISRKAIKSKFELEVQKDLLSRTKELAKSIKHYVGFKGYLKYYYDWNSKVYEMYPLPKVKPVITLHSFNETFLLDKPSEFHKGTPVFSLVRGFPISCSFKFKKNEYDMVDNNIDGKFEMAGFSSHDINAKLRSPYIRRLFALRNLTTIQIISIIMLVVISIMSTVFICMIWFQALK